MNMACSAMIAAIPANTGLLLNTPIFRTESRSDRQLSDDIAFEAPRQTMLDLPTGMLPNASAVSEDTQRRIDDAIRAIVMAGFDRATAILDINREVLERSARALLEKETLDEAAIRSLTADLRSV